MSNPREIELKGCPTATFVVTGNALKVYPGGRPGNCRKCNARIGSHFVEVDRLPVLAFLLQDEPENLSEKALAAGIAAWIKSEPYLTGAALTGYEVARAKIIELLRSHSPELVPVEENAA